MQPRPQKYEYLLFTQFLLSSNYFNEKYGIVCEFLKILEFLVQFMSEQIQITLRIQLQSTSLFGLDII